MPPDLWPSVSTVRDQPRHSSSSAFILVAIALVILAAGCIAPPAGPVTGMPTEKVPEAVGISDHMADCTGDTMAVYGHVKSRTGYNASVTIAAEARDNRGTILGKGEKTLDIPGNGTVSFMIWIPGGCPSLQVEGYTVHIGQTTFLM